MDKLQLSNNTFYKIYEKQEKWKSDENSHDYPLNKNKLIFLMGDEEKEEYDLDIELSGKEKNKLNFF
jgi:hypothetical protein